MSATCVPWYVSCATMGLSKHSYPVFLAPYRTWPVFAQGRGGTQLEPQPHCCHVMPRRFLFVGVAPIGYRLEVTVDND